MSLFYKLMINGIITNLDLELADCVKTLESYSFFNDNDKLSKVSREKSYDCDGELYVKKVKDNKTVYDLFYKNFHIHISLSDSEKIYSIRLKKNDDAWMFFSKDNDIDYSHPTNETYEVYVWYEVPVLDITKSIGCLYKNGTWDKYFYKTTNEFIKAVNEITDKAKFNEYYK